MKSFPIVAWRGRILLSVLLACPFLARALTVELRPVADTTLIETSPDNNMGAQYFFNAGTTGIDTRNRGLLMFDLAGAIPPNSVVESVDLLIEVVGSPTAGLGEFSLFELHRVLVPWGEGDKTQSFSPGLGEPASPGEATWNSPAHGTDQTWGAPGGLAGVDYAADPSALTFVGFEDLYEFESSPALVVDVQSWVDDPGNNFGWMLMTDAETTRYTARRFGSSEDFISAPILTVQYRPVPEPSTMILSLAGLVMLGFFSRRRLA
jgi:hypothetical protein